jgi:excisionase family DNA binding protein
MITHETPESEYCTVAEAAQMLRVSKPTVWRWIKSRRLPATRMSERIVRIRREDLRSLVQPVVPGPKMTREEIERYTVGSVGGTRSHREVMASIEATNKRILARRGGKPFESSVPLIHEARRERDERL